MIFFVTHTCNERERGAESGGKAGGEETKGRDKEGAENWGRELLLPESRACNVGPPGAVCIAEWREESRGRS